MIRSLLALIILTSFVYVKSFAQCNPSVLSNSVVANTTTTINGGFDPIWVCSGDTLHSDGGFHNIYLETGSVMTTQGGIDTIWVKDGASFFMTGGIHVIFYVTFSDLNLNGGIPYEYSCSSMAFDYSNAPPNGCALLPLAAIASSDTSICNKSCINFFSEGVSASSWQWSFEGASPSESSDENPENICYNEPGSYDVTLIVSNGNVSDTTTLNNFITVFPETPVPVLTQSNDTLYSSEGYLTYQWYIGDNTPIEGATNYFYVPDASGTYTILVTDSNGCTSSALINAVATGIHNIHSSDEFRVFPNPAAANITITTAYAEDLHFLDVSGREIFFMHTTSPGKAEVDISAFPNVFLIKTEKGDVKKVIRR